MHPLMQQVRQAIRSHRLIEQGERVLVAVSGGPDSLALLHLLVELREELECVLHVAHLDHGLRGEASAEDARFVAEVAERLGIPRTLERADLDLPSRRASLEAVAREARYAFLNRVADRVGADRIALGHHADDQAETVLMRLIRGCGIDGLAGIPLQRGRIIRPLLGVPRTAIEAYLDPLGLIPRQDASNAEPIFLRNRIRHELLPLLEERYNPAIREALTRLADLAASDSDCLDALVEERLNAMEDGAGLNIPALQQMHPSLQRRIVRRWLSRAVPHLTDISHQHVADVLELCDSAHPNAQLDLPGGLTVRREYDRLLATFGDLPCIPFCVRLTWPGWTEFPGGRIHAEMVATRHTGAGDPNCVEVDADALNREACVRNRRPGDWIRPFGMKGRRKLKDFLIDRKIPRVERDRIPLVAVGSEVLWVAGHRLSECCRVTEQTEETVRLCFTNCLTGDCTFGWNRVS